MEVNILGKAIFDKTIQWNLVLEMSDITKPSYNKVILVVPALYNSFFVYPDITGNMI